MDEILFLYKKSFETFIKKCVDIKKYNEKIKQIEVPIINDSEENEYRRNSFLESDYFYLRNNYKMDKLTSDELKYLKTLLFEEKLIDEDFIIKTYERVLFEDGDYVLYNYDSEEYALPSKTLVFEFAYDAAKINELDKYLKVDEMIKSIANDFCKELSEKIKINCSNEIYREMPKVYKKMDLFNQF